MPGFITGIGAGLSADVGDIKASVRATAPTGWLLCVGTIGNASSGATRRANADTLALFTFLWDGMSDANAPVSGGRGASAAADFAANKTITLPDTRERVIAGYNGGGAGLISSSMTVALGEKGGAGEVTLGINQLPPHSHGYNDPNLTSGSGADIGNGADEIIGDNSGTTAETGDGDPFSVLQPTILMNYFIKY